MIKQLEIENFKSFKHLNFRCRKLNLLTGMNGSGKSSFIQALRFINEFSSVFSQADRHVVGGFVDLFSSTFKVGTYRDLLYCYVGKKKSQRIARISAYAMGNDEPITLQIMPCPGERNYMDQPDAFVRYDAALKAYSKYQTLGGEDDSLKAAKFSVREKLISALRSVSITNYLSADRVAPEALHNLEAEISLNNNANGHRSASFLAHLAGLCIDPWCYHRKCKSEFLLDQINAWLDEISPGAHVYVKRIPELSRVVLSYSYERGRNSPHFRPINVGFGLSYVLPMLLALFTSSERDSLVLENPEAHLHPRGQSEVGKLLARAAAAGIQLFVETHSDHVINGVRVAVKEGIISPEDVNISFFERKAHAVEIVSGMPKSDLPRSEIYSTVSDIKVDRHGSLSMYPDGFMDEWTNQLVELLK